MPSPDAASRTLFDILWSRHVVREEANGKTLLYIDRTVIDDVRAPFVFANMKRRDLNIRHPELALLVQDHAVATFPNISNPRIEFAEATRNAAREFGLRLFDVGAPSQGISHVAAPESGFVIPGASYISVDSHAPTVGGIGALGFGCGSTEMEHVLATQCVWMQRPKQARLTLTGGLATGVTAKDIVLRALAVFGRETFAGMALEFAGAASLLSVEARMTLCNMAVEMGARTALVAPDDSVIDWIEARAGIHLASELRDAQAVSSLCSGASAVFDLDVTLECPDAPQITWGTSPAQVMAIDGVTPRGEDATTTRALAYMDLAPDTPLLGKKVDYVFIGSCTNARFDDLEAAANILRGRHVADGVRAVVVPGSRAVERQAAASGIKDIFIASGFVWGETGCSMCAGGGERIASGSRVVSTTNRNFENRQGPDVRTHLASPLTAAAAAIAGAICDPRSLMNGKSQ